jgi:uncharacterized protein
VSTSSASAPVTVMITRRVHPGRVAEFEQLMTGMRHDAAQFPGHLGGFLIGPEVAGLGCYRTLFAFDTEPHLQAWTQSAQRQAWLARIAELTYGDSAMRVLSGLEGWFALPAAQTKTPPPRWKMALVTWLGIFPLVLVLSNTVGRLLAPTSPVLGVMVVTALVTVAMSWLVMPFLARLFARWLYPPVPGQASNGPPLRPPATPSTEKS